MPVKKSKQFRWDGVEVRPYKDTPGAFEGVTRQVLGKPVGAKFELRYFEVEPGGYTSFERHMHDHLVIVVNGSGTVLLGDEETDIEPFDVVEVPPMTPHRFRGGSEALGFLCVVDQERDRPEPLYTANTLEAVERPTE
jgi:quercetin dioxygenase-like cupin family protein